jgi:acetyl esterase
VLTSETQLFLEGLKNLNLPPIENVPVEILRDQYETLVVLYGGSRIETIPFQDSILTLENIDKPITIRSFQVEAPKGVILFAHGGGWTRGSLNTHHVLCQNLAQATSSKVIAIEYSLSPENIYPAALNEVEAVYKWTLIEEALPISVAGDSAGANLMAGLMVRLNHQEFALPKGCIFFYPSFDLTGKLDSLNEFAEGYMLSRHSVMHYVSNYLGGNLALANLPEVSPLWQMKDINFPPTLIVAAGADPLRDDSRTAKDILQQKGALKGYLEVPGVIHAFTQFPGLFPESASVFEWIRKFYNKENC